MLMEWQSENKGIIYSYFDTYAAINDLIQTPASYGILIYYHTLNKQIFCYCLFKVKFFFLSLLIIYLIRLYCN